MLVDTLVRRWHEVDQGVWAGEQEDVIEALEHKIFPDYLAWQRPVVAELPDWHQGVLPGEGSLTVKTGNHQIGLVVVNSIFRGVGPELSLDHVVLAGEQLQHAVGESWKEWANSNALTLIVSGLSAPPPRLLDARSSTLLISGGNARLEPSPKRRGWFVADPKKPVCMKIGFDHKGVPVVQDSAKRAGKSAIPLSSLSFHNSLAIAPAPVDALVEDCDAAQVLSDFYRQVESGQMIAVLVSGLPGGGAVVDLDTLSRQLAVDVFGQVPQPEPSMDEIWSAAQAHLPANRLENTLNGLRGDVDSLYPDLHRVLSSPWWRVYDFSASGAIKVLAEGKLTPVILTSALTKKPGDRQNACEVTAMNGCFDGSSISVDFSVPAADTPSARALWFNRLRAEIVYHPVVFFAESAHSVALWRVLSSLNLPSGSGSYPRFIVAPEAGSSERARIHHSGLRHICESPTSFADARLRPGNQRLEQGKRRLAESLAVRDAATGMSLVSTMIDKLAKGSKGFLKGSEPEWGDITGNYAARLSVSDRVLDETRKFGGESRSIVILRGAAGSARRRH